MMAGIHPEYCKQEGLNYSGGGGGGESRGLRRARPPRAAAPLLRGALLRGGLEPGELLRRGASLRLGLGRGAVGARRARAHRHGAEVTCGIYSRNSIRGISDAVSMPRHAASSKGLRGSSVRRESGDGAPVDVRGVMPLTVAALAVSTCSRACAISPSAGRRGRRLAGPLREDHPLPSPQARAGARRARRGRPGAFRGPEARGPPRRRAARGSARRQDVRVHLGGARVIKSHVRLLRRGAVPVR